MKNEKKSPEKKSLSEAVTLKGLSRAVFSSAQGHPEDDRRPKTDGDIEMSLREDFQDIKVGVFFFWKQFK